MQLYGDISEKTKGLIRTVGRFKVERYAEKLEAKLETKRAEAAAMREQEAKKDEERERSLMSRADWGHNKKAAIGMANGGLEEAARAASGEMERRWILHCVKENAGCNSDASRLFRDWLELVW